MCGFSSSNEFLSSAQYHLHLPWDLLLIQKIFHLSCEYLLGDIDNDRRKEEGICFREVCQAICLLLQRNRETPPLPPSREVFGVVVFHTILYACPQRWAEQWPTYPIKVFHSLGHCIWSMFMWPKTDQSDFSIFCFSFFLFAPKLGWQRRASSLQLENFEDVSRETAKSQAKEKMREQVETLRDTGWRKSPAGIQISQLTTASVPWLFGSISHDLPVLLKLVPDVFLPCDTRVHPIAGLALQGQAVC